MVGQSCTQFSCSTGRHRCRFLCKCLLSKCSCFRTVEYMHDESESIPSEGASNHVAFHRLNDYPDVEGIPLLRKDMATHTIDYSPDLSHYEMKAIIGQGYGGAATFYAARHKPSDNILALKRINLEYDFDKNDLPAVQQDVVLTKQLKHKNLLSYLCTFITHGYVYAVMPYMSFGSAKDLLNYPFTQGLPELIVALILSDVLHALEYLHRRGIIHRGVKASHILISSKGQVCLTGLRDSCDLMCNGRRLKKIHKFEPNLIRNLSWLSPEILSQNLEGYNTKSDVYSVGMTACELANGIVPNANMPPTQMLLETLRGPSPLLIDASTCQLIETPEQQAGEVEGMPIHFKQRIFTEGFHEFAHLCLLKDVSLRPSVPLLLRHPFFKQCHRSHTTLNELLHSLVPTAENVDANHLLNGINCPLVDSVSGEMEEANIDSWSFEGIVTK